MEPNRNLQSAGLSDPPPLALDAAGVAALLGLAFEAQFISRRRRLEKHGFPRPLPLTPLRWPRVAVERWIAASGRVAPAYSEEAARNPVVVALEAYRGDGFRDGRAA